MQSNIQYATDPFMPDDGVRKASAEQVSWRILGILFGWRRLIVATTAVVAVASVVITLMMPNVYRATARVLIPESGGLSASMLRGLPSAATALLGLGGGGDYVRYLAILNSRTAQEAVVDTFDLVRVYEFEDNKTPREDALAALADYLSFELDEEFDYLSISAIDTDPHRAAEIANFLVRRLNEINTRLSAQNAHNYRRFIEQRYLEAEADMDSVLNAMQTFQRQYGVYDLPAQTQGFFEQIAQLRTQALQAEIQHEVLLDQYGAENASVEAARQMARAANEKYRNALAGQEQLLPIPQSAVPEVARQYAELEMERAIQVAILEIVRPLYEQARLQEEQEMEAVQVLDPAVPPVKKAGPRRSIIVIVATLSAFLLACTFALVMSWWKQHHAAFADRLQRAIAEAEGRGTTASS